MLFRKKEPVLYVLGVDSSLRRPGFSLISYERETGNIELVRLSNVNNKSSKDSKKHIGKILNEILAEFQTYLDFLSDKNAVFVREKGYTNSTTYILSEVLGIMDWALYLSRKYDKFEEIAVTTIKKHIGGKGTATKEEVKDGLKKYVGEQNYACDDESDATAVALTYLSKTYEVLRKNNRRIKNTAVESK